MVKTVAKHDPSMGVGFTGTGAGPGAGFNPYAAPATAGAPAMPGAPGTPADTSDYGDYYNYVHDLKQPADAAAASATDLTEAAAKLKDIIGRLSQAEPAGGADNSKPASSHTLPVGTANVSPTPPNVHAAAPPFAAKQPTAPAGAQDQTDPQAPKAPADPEAANNAARQQAVAELQAVVQQLSAAAQRASMAAQHVAAIAQHASAKPEVPPKHPEQNHDQAPPAQTVAAELMAQTVKSEESAPVAKRRGVFRNIVFAPPTGPDGKPHG